MIPEKEAWKKKEKEKKEDEENMKTNQLLLLRLVLRPLPLLPVSPGPLAFSI